MMWSIVRVLSLFFFNDTATTEIYTLSLHDALPIWKPRVFARCSSCRKVGLGRVPSVRHEVRQESGRRSSPVLGRLAYQDRKSTRLNSSHANISYAVFCLKKKNVVFLR